MPNDMMIPAVQAIASSPDPRPLRNARGSAPEPRAAPTPYVNPTLRLEPDVGLVVMEFRDESGKVTTIPNERQLAAYRAHQEAAADLASARNAIESSAVFQDVEGFAEPQLGFGEASTSSAATGTPATGASPSPAANPTPLSAAPARPATPAPAGLMPPGAAPNGALPNGASLAGSAPTGSAPTGPALPANDGSAPVAGPTRA